MTQVMYVTLFIVMFNVFQLTTRRLYINRVQPNYVGATFASFVGFWSHGFFLRDTESLWINSLMYVCAVLWAYYLLHDVIRIRNIRYT